MNQTITKWKIIAALSGILLILGLVTFNIKNTYRNVSQNSQEKTVIISGN